MTQGGIMANNEWQRCSICGTTFESATQLEDHRHEAHESAQSEQRGALPSDADAGIQERPATTRKDREFTRTHFE
jgi:hypothetical protein